MSKRVYIVYRVVLDKDGDFKLAYNMGVYNDLETIYTNSIIKVFSNEPKTIDLETVKEKLKKTFHVCVAEEKVCDNTRYYYIEKAYLKF